MPRDAIRTTRQRGIEAVMKGPFERMKYDFRRVWECPDCHHRERTDGRVTSIFCKCQRQKDRFARVAMHLVEDAPRRRV